MEEHKAKRIKGMVGGKWVPGEGRESKKICNPKERSRFGCFSSSLVFISFVQRIVLVYLTSVSDVHQGGEDTGTRKISDDYTV